MVAVVIVVSSAFTESNNSITGLEIILLQNVLDVFATLESCQNCSAIAYHQL